MTGMNFNYSAENHILNRCVYYQEPFCLKFTTYYNGYEKTNLQRILNDDGTPLTVSGKGVFIDGANLLNFGKKRKNDKPIPKSK